MIKINGYTIDCGRHLIILDRDAVINESNKTDSDRGPFVLLPDDFTFRPGVLKAIRLVTEAGYICVVLTSQACVTQGLITLEELNSIHDYMTKCIEKEGGRIHHIEVVYPSNDDDSNIVGKAVSKYNGIRNIMKKFGITHNDVCWSLGDSPWDIYPADILGFHTIQITVPNWTGDCGADYKVDSLPEAANFIISNHTTPENLVKYKYKLDKVDGNLALVDRKTYSHLTTMLHSVSAQLDNILTTIGKWDSKKEPYVVVDDLEKVHATYTLEEVEAGLYDISKWISNIKVVSEVS